MKNIKTAIRAVLSLGILSCLIFGAAGCGTEQKLPEGDKVAIGFHRKVEGVKETDWKRKRPIWWS